MKHLLSSGLQENEHSQAVSHQNRGERNLQRCSSHNPTLPACMDSPMHFPLNQPLVHQLNQATPIPDKQQLKLDP